MATITNYEILPTPGAVWQRILQYWAAFAVDATKTLVSVLSGITTEQCRSIKVTYTQGANTVIDHFGFATILSTSNSSPVDYVLGSPGWNTPPPIVTEGTLTAAQWQTSFAALAMAARLKILTDICGQGTFTWTLDTYTGIFAGYNGYRYRAALKNNMYAYLDAVQLTVRVAGATVIAPGDVPTSDGKCIGQPSVLMAQTTISTAAIVTALQDLLNRDVMTQLNNGAVTVLGWSGDVIAAP